MRSDIRPSRLVDGTDRKLRVVRRAELADEQVATVLRELGLLGVLERIGGLDVERDWDDVLSLREQQLLCIARAIVSAPRFVFLERPRAALGAVQTDRVLRLLDERSITYLTLGDGGERLVDHDAVLELGDDGAWTWKALAAGRETIEQPSL